MDNGLSRATWFLVVVTGMLVVVAVIPLIRDILDRRQDRMRRSTLLVPDMNILKSRLVGAVRHLSGYVDWDDDDIEEQWESCGQELEMLSEIIETGERPSLEFVSELYIMRHLLTFARHHLHVAIHSAGSDTESVRARDESLREAQRSYKAAELTLNAAEALLPSWARTIDGKNFWDRFAEVSDAREAEAARLLLADETFTRTQRGSSS